jgi:hypothetical protein
MKVRILSGNQARQVVELPQLEAEVAISTGYGESAEPPAPTPKPEPAKPEPPRKAAPPKTDGPKK